MMTPGYPHTTGLRLVVHATDEPFRFTQAGQANVVAGDLWGPRAMLCA